MSVERLLQTVGAARLKARRAMSIELRGCCNSLLLEERTSINLFANSTVTQVNKERNMAGCQNRHSPTKLATFSKRQKDRQTLMYLISCNTTHYTTQKKGNKYEKI